VSLPGQLRQLFPEAKIMSLGGATEASVWSILYPIETIDPEWKSVPYGKPMVNQSFQVLNGELGPCPAWVPGNLYIGGIGVAKGYWRDENKTRASFIRHPATGELLYRTGDMGRYLPDGNIEFLGRDDMQGHRIELGEIEAHLQEHDSIASCVLAVRENAQKERHLVAYVVSKPAGERDPSPLRDYLRTKLPEYMVPSTFVFLDALPLTTNGKVDRKALPAPVFATRPPTNAAGRPSDELQAQLTELWESILGVHPVAVDDSFFDLGGNSIMTLRLYSELRRKFNAAITLPDLFQAPSVAQMANILSNVGYTLPTETANHQPRNASHLIEGLWSFIRRAWA
jgi:non-ribosomal peptide synthetase component F